MPITLSFESQTVLITGGATGIGFAIASAFGESGARIALNDIEDESLQEACERLAAREIECRGFRADPKPIP